MLKITAYHGPDGLQLNITNSVPPTIDDLYSNFSQSHHRFAVSRVNHKLGTASKIVLVEATYCGEAGESRQVTVWLRANQLDLMSDDINANGDTQGQDVVAWVDDSEFDPWAEFADFEKS